MMNKKEQATRLRQSLRAEVSRLDMNLQELEAFGHLLGPVGKDTVREGLTASIQRLRDIADHHGITIEETT